MTNNIPNIKFFAFSILVSLVLSACTLEFNTAIQPDGSGELKVEFGLGPEEQVEAQSTAGSLENLCTSAQAFVRLPPGAQTYIEQRGEEIWCGVVAPFTDLNELTALLFDQPGVEVNQITFLEDRLIFDVTMDLSRRLEVGGEKYKAPEVTWEVTVPGTLVGHNADSFEGNTLAWVVRRGELRTMRAESVSSIPTGFFGTGLPVPLITLVSLPCLCLVVLISGGVVLFRRRRKTA